MTTIAETLTRPDFTTCSTCRSYADRRSAVLAPAMAERILRTGETPQQVVDQFMAGVHARHLQHNTNPVPAVVLTDTELQITSLNQLVANPDAWHALRGWCNTHGIDDRAVVTSEPIVRLADSIEYMAYVTDPTGKRLTRGGDPIRERITHPCRRRPSPWPVEVLELAERTRA